MVKKNLVCKTLKNGNKQWVACFGNKTTKPKAKTIKIKRKKKEKPTAKPKPKAPKKLSAGKAVLLTQRGFMGGVGAYAIPKKEKARRVKLAERRINSYEARIYYFTDNMGDWRARTNIERTTKMLKKAKHMKKKYIEILREGGGVGKGRERKVVGKLGRVIKILEGHILYKKTGSFTSMAKMSVGERRERKQRRKNNLI